MAVTSLWPVKGRADKVIDYARNPEKTTEAGVAGRSVFHAVGDVLEYAADAGKTERRSYVTCLNCREDTAAAQFMETKRLWGKLEGRACYHGYQSFRAEEVTAETAHEIGVRLAEALWGDRFEVLVATHCNTGLYHNHFVINAVSFWDGYKFCNSPGDYARMREASDRLCREYALSVLAEPRGRGRSYAERQAEKAGRPTLRGSIRADIDRAILASTTEGGFVRSLEELGYVLKTRGKGGQPLRYPALKPPGAKGYFRFHKLGDAYTLEQIRLRILQNLRKQVPFPEAAAPKLRRFRTRSMPRPRITGLRALYFRYCYELHILTQRPASVKRVPFSLREDLTRLDRLDRETRFLGRRKIGTMEELTACRGCAAAELDALTARRGALRRQLRKLSRPEDAAAVREEIAGLTGRLRELRRELALCDGIAQRSAQVREHLEQLQEQKRTERKEVTRDELFGRRGGTGRPYDTGGR